jgi:carbonic anhydrase/acetyltransferase-like protein (isoleucine patch superfamily)
MPLFRLGAKAPVVAGDAWVAPTAAVIGDATLAEGASVWFGCTVRADTERVVIGARANVQDGSVLHADPGYPLELGEDVTVGHQAMLHGCTVGAGSLVGIQAVILNGAKIGRGCLVGAGSLVTERAEFPDHSLILGRPAQLKRPLRPEEIAGLADSASHYRRNALRYRGELEDIDQGTLASS